MTTSLRRNNVVTALSYPNIAQLVERPTVDESGYRAVPGSNPGVRILFYYYTRMLKSNYEIYILFPLRPHNLKAEFCGRK